MLPIEDDRIVTGRAMEELTDRLRATGPQPMAGSQFLQGRQSTPVSVPLTLKMGGPNANSYGNDFEDILQVLQRIRRSCRGSELQQIHKQAV
jgi:hypothetical protein